MAAARPVLCIFPKPRATTDLRSGTATDAAINGHSTSRSDRGCHASRAGPSPLDRKGPDPAKECGPREWCLSQRLGDVKRPPHRSNYLTVAPYPGGRCGRRATSAEPLPDSGRRHARAAAPAPPTPALPSTTAFAFRVSILSINRASGKAGAVPNWPNLAVPIMGTSPSWWPTTTEAHSLNCGSFYVCV